MKQKTQTVNDLIQEWDKEASESLYLWKGVAQEISRTLKNFAPKDARILLRHFARASKHMGICMSYTRAANDLSRIIKNQNRRNKIES